MDTMEDHNDYLAHFDLSKEILASHKNFADFATTKYLKIEEMNPFRDNIRECQYCGEIWMLVSGCTGNTTCGNRTPHADVIESDKDKMSFSGVVWVVVGTSYQAKYVGNRGSRKQSLAQ